MPGFLFDDDVREVLHLLRQLQIGNVLEIGLLAANLGRVAQDGAEQSLSQRLQQDDALAARHDDSAEADDLLVAHGVANDGKRLFRDPLARRDIIGRVEIPRVDFHARGTNFSISTV